MQGVRFELTKALSHWVLSPAELTRLSHPCVIDNKIIGAYKVKLFFDNFNDFSFRAHACNDVNA